MYDFSSPKMLKIFLYSVSLILSGVPWHMTFQICCEVYVVDSSKTRFFSVDQNTQCIGNLFTSLFS